MSTRSYCVVSAVVFALVAVGHLVRAVQGWPVVVAGWPAPAAVSWAAVAIAGGLAIWGLRLTAGGARG